MSASESESSVASIDANCEMYRCEFHLEDEEHSPEDVNTIGKYSEFEAYKDEPLAGKNWLRNYNHLQATVHRAFQNNVLKSYE